MFISELADKTQLLVLSFSSRVKTCVILLGVALGSLFSHGVAIMFGSSLGSLKNSFIHNILQPITYFSFIFLGIISLLPKINRNDRNSERSLLERISALGLNYVIIIAFSIMIGEFGDKTFIASIGLGINYPNHKIGLLIGAILGMIFSNCFAIFLGKFMKNKISENAMEILSGIIFLVFGFIGIFSLYFYNS